MMMRFRNTAYSMGIALATAALLIPALATAAGELDGASAVKTLRGLQSKYAAIDNVYMRATVHMWVAGSYDDPHPATVGEGTYEYWAQGDFYRIRVDLDESLGLADNVDVAYDGAHFQLRDIARDLLSYQKQRPESLPVAMPNPLFLGIDFLSRDDDRCQGCQLDLSKVASRRHWNSRLDSAAMPKVSGASALVHLRGGTFGGVGYHFRVKVEEGLPRQIDRFTDDGRIMSRVVLRDYRDVDLDGVRLPIAHSLSIASADYEGHGQQNMFADIEIEELRVNERLALSAFTLDIGDAKMVWDGDAREFVRHPAGVVPDQLRQQMDPGN